MKTQAYTALLLVAVMVGCAYGRHPYQYWIEFFRGQTSDICGEDMCWPEGGACFKQMKEQSVTNEEQLNEAKTNLTECAQTIGATKADFSSLTLKEAMSHNKNNKDPATRAADYIKFMNGYGVTGKEMQYEMLACLMNKTEELPNLRTCLAATKTGETEETMETEESE